MRPPTVAESPRRSAPLMRTAPPKLLPMCWRARCCSRCTPSRGRQRWSPFSCSAPASRQAACSALQRRTGLHLPMRARHLLPCPFARFPSSSGGATLIGQFLRRWRGARLTGSRHSPGARSRGSAQSAQILANWPGLSPHSFPRARRLVILSARQHYRPGSPAGRTPRIKKQVQRSNVGAALCVGTMTLHPVGGHECSRLLALR